MDSTALASTLVNVASPSNNRFVCARLTYAEA
jgi:hypothetical protein